MFNVSFQAAFLIEPSYYPNRFVITGRQKAVGYLIFYVFLQTYFV